MWVTKMLIILAILLIALNAFDFYSTYKILKNGGSEVNPVMNFLIKKLGLVLALVLSKLLVLICIAVLVWLEMVYLLVILVAIYIWVAVHNFREMKK